MNAEKTASTADASSQGSHWLKGHFFVPVPDMSDEISWVISKGRAWPAFMAIMRLLRQQERRGKTAETKADAADGRLVVGVNALARAAGMTSTSILRQLRFLERQGFIKTHQERFVTETDPATGKITRNAAKAPPKVIVMTWQDSFQRPVNASKKAKRDTAESNAIPAKDTAESNAKASQDRVRNDGVSIDENLHRGFHPMDENGRPTRDTSREVSPTASQTKQAAQPPTRQAWEVEAAKAEQQRRVEAYAYILGMTTDEVIDLWKRDHQQLGQRVIAAGYDPSTCRRHGSKGTAEAYQEKTPPSTYAIRRRTTAGVTLTPSDLQPAEDPAQRLQEAVEALPDASRDRADQHGQEMIDEEAAAATRMLIQTVERKRAELASS